MVNRSYAAEPARGSQPADAALPSDPADDPSDVGHDDAAATNAADPHAPIPVTFGVRVINLLAVVLPFAGLVAGIVWAWGDRFDWLHLSLMAGMYLVTVFGVTIGFHRLFTHRAFQTNAVVRAALAIFGSMAVEGPLLKWVALHRRHHQHSDHHDDPHSPHLHGHGLKGVLQGLYHAHVGWIFKTDSPGLERYVKDLSRDRVLRAISALFPLWVTIGMLVPAAIAGLVTMTWSGALLGLLWGGFARVFLVHHVTWSINSVCHLWGRQTYKTTDESRNNVIFGILAMGEGWHNNHHAFPTSARHGLAWWQFDASYWTIRLMELCGLAYNVKVPSDSALAAKRVG